jgi:hypothetical protein
MITEEKRQEALDWWENLPSEMKADFEEPESDDDIIDYYLYPAANADWGYVSDL